MSWLGWSSENQATCWILDFQKISDVRNWSDSLQIYFQSQSSERSKMKVLKGHILRARELNHSWNQPTCLGAINRHESRQRISVPVIRWSLEILEESFPKEASSSTGVSWPHKLAFNVVLTQHIWSYIQSVDLSSEGPHWINASSRELSAKQVSCWLGPASSSCGVSHNVGRVESGPSVNRG